MGPLQALGVLVEASWRGNSLDKRVLAQLAKPLAESFRRDKSRKRTQDL